MNCPIFYFAFPKLGKEIDALNTRCIKENCAWFHPSTQSCEVSRIASNLSTIGNYLKSIDYTLTLTELRGK